MTTAAKAEQFGPWNPGLSSDLPGKYLPLATVFRKENVSTSLSETHELADFCGLPAHECTRFRAERLIVHEVLVRVTADMSVYAGRRYEDLGINFRRMATVILETHVAQHRADLLDLFDRTLDKANHKIRHELEESLFAAERKQAEQTPASIWHRILGRDRPIAGSAAPNLSPAEQLQATLTQWHQRSVHTDDDFEVAVLGALSRVMTGIARKHGRIVGDIDLIALVSTTLVSNEYGSRVLGDALDPIIRDAARSEGYKLLPTQARPVVMNVKGASASGKSTMRPLQQKLSERIGISWDEFALISPDIWRKYLLDYDALGPAFKYAGMMAGHEVEIIDRKLDRHMAGKAARSQMTHLLIDRFRFDSFAAEADEPVRLLTRFGDLVYMFFMVTPPAATVERAWRRGQQVGRYKAVDDLLAHNIEAYSGIPELFFTWARNTDKQVHYEFLDNSVTLGNLPKTIAYGWNGEMNVLDITGLLDIDRFGKVNVDARRPEDVHRMACMGAKENTAFLRRCVKLAPAMNFADQSSGKIYARMEAGQWVWCDIGLLEWMLRDRDTREGLAAIGLTKSSAASIGFDGPRKLDLQHADTLGAWGLNLQSPAAGHFGA